MSLLDPVSDIMRQLLLDLLLGTDGGDEWAIFVGLLPDTPDKAIAIYDTAGKLDGRLMTTGKQIEHKGIQIIVRAPEYLDAINKSNEIMDTLDLQNRIDVEMESDRVYLIQNISRSGATLPLGLNEDDRRRYHFSSNALITLNQEGT